MNKSRTIRLRQALFSLPFGLLFLLGSMMYASPSWAWGDLGHKIICQIAFEELNDKARNEVTRLIALDATFNSFTDACTWPDHPRKRAEEHFINVGRLGPHDHCRSVPCGVEVPLHRDPGRPGSLAILQR